MLLFASRQLFLRSKINLQCVDRTPRAKIIVILFANLPSLNVIYARSTAQGISNLQESAVFSNVDLVKTIEENRYDGILVLDIIGMVNEHAFNL